MRIAELLAITALIPAAALVAQTSDVTPPQLLEFDFTPKSIDVRTSPQHVTATLRVSDDISGVRVVFVDFRSPSNKQQFFGANRVSGDQFDGVYEGTLEMPQFVESGVWTARVILQDSLNVSSLPPATLQGLGFPTDLTVTSNPDTNPPEVESFSLSPSATDVSASDVAVTVTLHLTDDVSGIQSERHDLVVSLRSPSGNQTQFLSGSQLAQISGDHFDGTWQGVKMMPQFSESGTWTGRVEVQDQAGNFGQFNWGPVLTIASVPSDTVAPMPTGLQFSPLFVNTSEGPQTIQLSLSATDDLAGVDFSAPTPDFNFGAPLFFRSPSGGQVAGAFDLQLSSGTPQNGTWTGTMQLGQFSEQGTWRVGQLRLTDRTRNEDTYDGLALAALGFPIEVVVVRPSLVSDGNVGTGGGTVEDQTFGSQAQVTFPSGAVDEDTQVAIDVFAEPVDVETPQGFQGLGTNFVNISLTPEPTYPFPAPGVTLVLPLAGPELLPVGFAIPLFFVESVSGTLQPMLDLAGFPVVGSVDPGQLTATFEGISHFTIVVALVPDVVPVTLDIRPNDVNSTSRGRVPVAVLSTESFLAATEIDQNSITFGKTGDEASLSRCNGNGEDVNADGILDLLCHFTTALTGLGVGDTQGILKGKTWSGMNIQGSDLVNVVK